MNSMIHVLLVYQETRGLFVLWEVIPTDTAADMDEKSHAIGTRAKIWKIF